VYISIKDFSSLFQDLNQVAFVFPFIVLENTREIALLSFFTPHMAYISAVTNNIWSRNKIAPM
jgi:hypothetical protein